MLGESYNYYNYVFWVLLSKEKESGQRRPVKKTKQTSSKSLVTGNGFKWNLNSSKVNEALYIKSFFNL